MIEYAYVDGEEEGKWGVYKRSNRVQYFFKIYAFNVFSRFMFQIVQ